MIRNLSQIFRVLFRNRTYAILNIAGLSIGIAASALILLWVEYNLNPNRSVPKRDHLHMIGQNQYYGDDIRTFFVASPGLFNALNEMPGVKRSTRYSETNLSFRIDGNDAFFLKI